MGTRASRWHDQQGFTLVELMIAIAITGLIVSAIAGALIVSFATTGVTQTRLAESHDVQVTSAYLANDVQSAASVNLASGGTCSGASTPLVTFNYDHGNAVYACGTAANGETQVTRRFGGDTVVLAHFAGTARPTVTCAPNAGCGGTVNSVTMAFTEASGYSYTLVGSRRGISSPGAGTGTPPGDVTVLSTGTSSPLWVQGGCQDPGTSGACSIDPNLTAQPVSDVLTTGWTPTPASPSTLWDKLNDQSDSTWVTTPTKDKEARVALSPVDPPDGTPVTVEVRAMSVGTGAAKLKVSVYDLTSGPAALATQTINNVNSLKNYDWTATGIPTASYAHLTLGFSLTTNGDTVSVYGVAVDTASPAGLLTIKGSLTINSTSSSAVKLSGSKTGTQITISPGDFRILQGGASPAATIRPSRAPAARGAGSSHGRRTRRPSRTRCDRWPRRLSRPTEAAAAASATPATTRRRSPERRTRRSTRASTTCTTASRSPAVPRSPVRAARAKACCSTSKTGA